MLKFLIIFLFTFPACLFGQSRKVVVVVDTLKLMEPDLNTFDFDVKLGHRDVFRNVKTENKPIRNYANQPNYKISLDIIDDSSTVKIFIDNHGSYIEIIGLYKLSIDTLWIRNLPFYNDLTRSTSKCDISWYRYPTNGEKIKVTKHQLYSYETKSKFNLKNFSLIVNGKIYVTNLKEESSSQISISHGYKPRNYQKKNGDYKKRTRKFYNYCTTTIYKKKGQIEI